MISVIVCSRHASVAERLSKNIRDTIGVSHEMIVIDNTIAREGICTVYNKGAALAIYPLLCFVHEDVLFATAHWGQKLAAHFSDPSIGVMGVAGGDSLSMVPSTWSNSFFSNEINIIQRNPGSSKKEISHVYVTATGELTSRKQVLVIDGVFMCVRKSVFKKYRFDNSLCGFHGYDVDFSLQLSREFKNYVAFDILLEHFSEGSLNDQWLDSTFAIAKKWKKQLPISLHSLTREQQVHYHWQSLHVLMQHMFRLNCAIGSIYFYCLKYSCTRFFTLRRFLSMNKLFLKSMMATTTHSNETRPAGRNKLRAILNRISINDKI